MGNIDMMSFVASIISIVLSIVAIVISMLFYKLGKEDSKEIRETSQNIETQTRVLNVLFDKMLNTSFDMIRENSRTMQTYILNSVGQTKSYQEESSSDSNGEDNSICYQKDK